jgi:hypothetical protein
MPYLGQILLGKRGRHKNRGESLDSTHKWGIANIEVPVTEISVLSVGATVYNDPDDDEHLR